MEPDAAAQVLLAAGAGGAAPAGAAVALVCRVLTDVARVPVARLREILPQAPELLAAAPEELLARYAALGEAWPAERQLQQAVATYPGVLARDFPANLQRCMATLSELGFSNAQVAAAILRAPSLATLRRYELLTTLKQAGVTIQGADPSMLEFLSKRPQCMTPAGAGALAALLKEFRAWGVDSAQAQAAVARCPRLLTVPAHRMRDVAAALLKFGLAPEQRAAVIKGWPQVLRMGPARVRQTLGLLAAAGIEPERVAAYPRVFTHDPLTVLGPRLAYIKAHQPQELTLSLATLLSRGDDEFVEQRLSEDADLDDYLAFAEAWAQKYARAARARRAAPKAAPAGAGASASPNGAPPSSAGQAQRPAPAPVKQPQRAQPGSQQQQQQQRQRTRQHQQQRQRRQQQQQQQAQRATAPPAQ